MLFFSLVSEYDMLGLSWVVRKRIEGIYSLEGVSRSRIFFYFVRFGSCSFCVFILCGVFFNIVF